MALNTPYKRINPNSINYAAVGQKDPWFALGYALGEGYWNNYNARGEAKATETIKQGLDNFLKYGNVDGPAPQDLVDQAMTISVGKEKVSSGDVEKASNKDSDKTIKPEVDHGLMKWDYIQSKYANSPNPVGDSISAQKLLNGTEIALNNTNMGAFDENAFKLAIMDKLTKDGRSPQQREAAWAAIQPMIAGKKAQYNGKVVNELYGLYEQANMNQDYSNARRFALEINKLDPNLGKHLLSGTVTQKDIWEQQNKERMARGEVGSNGLFKSEADELKYLDAAIEKANENPPTTETEKATLAMMKARRNQIRQNGISSPVNKQIFGIKWEDDTVVGDLVDDAIKSGNQELVVSNLNVAYQNGLIDEKRYNKFLTKIKDSNKKVETAKAKEEPVEEHDFSKRSGLALAMSEGKTVKQWLDETFGGK